jgi:hypothetical protein
VGEKTIEVVQDAESSTIACGNGLLGRYWHKARHCDGRASRRWRGCVDRLPEQLTLLFDTELSTRAERRKFNLLPPRLKTVSLASYL